MLSRNIVLLVFSLIVIIYTSDVFAGWSLQRLLDSAPTYGTCRDPLFGQIGWKKEEIITQSSGRRGGGNNPTGWCKQLEQMYVNSRSISQPYESEILHVNERVERSWFGKVEYNYECVLKIKWEPLYEERTDARCGIR